MTGKKRYSTRTVRGGKREAQRTLAAMVTDAERGLTPRSSATVGDLLEARFTQATQDFSPTTVKETRGFIDRSLLPGLGERPLAKLRPAELDAFYARLREAGGVDGRPLAAATVRRIHVILRPCPCPGRQVVGMRLAAENPGLTRRMVISNNANTQSRSRQRQNSEHGDSR